MHGKKDKGFDDTCYTFNNNVILNLKIKPFT